MGEEPEKACSFSFLSSSVECRGVTVPQIHSLTYFKGHNFCFSALPLLDLHI